MLYRMAYFLLVSSHNLGAADYSPNCLASEVNWTWVNGGADSSVDSCANARQVVRALACCQVPSCIAITHACVLYLSWVSDALLGLLPSCTK